MWRRSPTRPMVAAMAAALAIGSAGCGPAVPQASTPSSSSSSPSPAASPTPAASPSPAFHARVLHIWPELAAVLRGSSWHPGCPVNLAELRYVQVTHWDFTGAQVTGELIVHEDVTGMVTGLFADLFELGFPIERMRRVDDYGADDTASMAANNTSAFNCRWVAGTDTWSEHAYGRAVDVNPVQNPYVRGGTVQPEAGRAYLDRGAYRPGMLVEGRPEVAALRRHAWHWGGDWQASKDYQHLSTTGR